MFPSCQVASPVSAKITLSLFPRFFRVQSIQRALVNVEVVREEFAQRGTRAGTIIDGRHRLSR
jgi:hypothetical protein